jgi:hypothetical protein
MDISALSDTTGDLLVLISGNLQLREDKKRPRVFKVYAIILVG